MSAEISNDEVPRERPPRILISAASGKVPLVRAMKDAARRLSPKAEVICGDMDPGALTKYIADDFWVMPETTQHHLNDNLTTKRGPLNGAKLTRIMCQTSPQLLSNGL